MPRDQTDEQKEERKEGKPATKSEGKKEEKKAAPAAPKKEEKKGEEKRKTKKQGEEEDIDALVAQIEGRAPGEKKVHALLPSSLLSILAFCLDLSPPSSPHSLGHISVSPSVPSLSLSLTTAFSVSYR